MDDYQLMDMGLLGYCRLLDKGLLGDCQLLDKGAGIAVGLKHLRKWPGLLPECPPCLQLQ